jgi:L-rhamnose mutarotase
MSPALTEKIAFRMFLNPGCADEYRRRHDAIWPELVALLHGAGIRDYSIFLHEEGESGGGVLFAVLRRPAEHTMDALPAHPVMQRWWQHMKDLMRTHPDGAPVAEPLPGLFHLD